MFAPFSRIPHLDLQRRHLAAIILTLLFLRDAEGDEHDAGLTGEGDDMQSLSAPHEDKNCEGVNHISLEKPTPLHDGCKRVKRK